MAKKSLAETHPEVAKQWHPTKNGDLTPYDFTAGSGRKVWWKCPKGDDHEYQNRVVDKTRGIGCSVCRGFTVVLSNCLSTTHPHLTKEWHPTKNGDLTPYDFTAGSGRKVWWKCPKGDDHEWEMLISKRSLRGFGCTVCNNHKVVLSNCLAIKNPRLAKEWHPTRNGSLTPFDVTNGTHKKVWWKCNKGEDHEWEAIVVSRDLGRSCPFCSGHKVCLSNSLATTHPELAKEWHPKKNGNLIPSDLTSGSDKRVWWKCEKGDDHEWETNVHKRTGPSHRNCPICSNQKAVLSNCLATTNPNLAKLWHPTRNGSLTPFDVVDGSHKAVWWKCNKGEDHEWKSIPYNNSTCPYCSLTPQSRQELTITFELRKVFANIDPKGYKTFLGGRLRSIDIYIPKLNLCIEFDGAYWHKGKRELDKIKSEMILKEGFRLIRVREEPLKKINDTDIISMKPYDGKQVTNDILSVILDKYDLDDTKVSKIKEYRQREELQNEKALDRYIDKILTEKAEKK